MPIGHLFLLFNFFRCVFYFLAFVISALGTSCVRGNLCSAMGTFDEFFGLEREHFAGAVSTTLGVSLLLN
jgi:hypothetical protein